MADYDSVHDGRRVFRQKGELVQMSSSPTLSGNDWPPTEGKVDSMPPRRRSMAVAADVEDSETEVGTNSSAAQRRRRRRQQLAQKKRPPPAVPDSPPSVELEPSPERSTRLPRTRQSSLARTATSLSMRTGAVPGLTRSQTAPHRWPSHIYDEEADNSRSDSRRSGSRRDASPLYRSMTGSKLSSRTSLSEEEEVEEYAHTDDTTSTPEEIRVIKKHKSVQQQRSRNAVPPAAPPPPRVPNPPATRRGEVIYEEDGDSGHHTPKSRGHSRPGTVYEFDMQDVDDDHRRRARSRLGRPPTAYEASDLDMKRIEQRTRSKSRPRSAVAPDYEEDVDGDGEEPRRSEPAYEDDLEKRLRARSRPRSHEQSFDAADDYYRRSASRVRRAETVYDLEEHDFGDHRRSKSKSRGAETDYEMDTEDVDRRLRAKSKSRREDDMYELDSPPQGAPEPPRTRRGEVIYEEDREMVATRHNPFSDQSRSRSRHTSAARTEKQHYSPRKELRRRSSVDEAHPRSHSRSNRLAVRHYESEVAYRDSRPPSARKAQTTIGSNMQSQSVGPSRRPSSFIGQFFGPAFQAHPAHDRPPKLVDCVACWEEFPSQKIAKLKCGHRMCNSCLKNVFKASIRDPQLMPPKCCTEHIVLKHVDRLFDTGFKHTWNRKFAEFSAKNRIYCPSSRCGAWIKPGNIRRDADGRKVATCGRCHTKVCCKCNGKWHRSRDCPRDEGTRVFMQQMKDNGWQRCHQCQAVVELKEGCNHMTCRCGAEFCMICGLKWKGCDCPWFNPDTMATDGLDDLQSPLSMPSARYGSRPPSPSGLRSEIPIRRPRPQVYEEDMLLPSPRLRDQRGEMYAMRTPDYDERYDYHDSHHDGDYLGDSRAVKQAAHYIFTDNLRRSSEPGMMPPVPSPPAAPLSNPRYVPHHEKSNSGGDYITGVQRARAGYVYRRPSPHDEARDRLADRFNSDTRQHTPTRTTAHGPPPMLKSSMTVPIMPIPMPMPMQMCMPLSMPPPPMGMMGGHPPGHMHYHHHSAPPGMGPLLRRHTMEEERYNHLNVSRPPPISREHSSSSAPKAPKLTRQHTREEIYDEDDDVTPPTPTRERRRVTSRRYTETEVDVKPSTLAGLTDPRRGVHRVNEWATYVEPGLPKEEEEKRSVAAGSVG